MQQNELKISVFCLLIGGRRNGAIMAVKAVRLKKGFLFHLKLEEEILFLKIRG